MTTKERGDAAEDAALAHLQAAGLALVARNYRTPGRGGGEIDLVMRDPKDGTLVFVEVRRRASAAFGGAGGSITGAKQRASCSRRATTSRGCARRRRAASTWCWWRTAAASSGCVPRSTPADR
jgi:Holliday junction resolvase-like predicted endonuclease